MAFYEPESTDEQINQAAELAGLGSLLNEIGLDGQIGASGRTISGGQAQRVALARAFLSRTRNILFLDEPTAHLDNETELEIKANILPLLENKLVLLLHIDSIGFHQWIWSSYSMKAKLKELAPMNSYWLRIVTIKNCSVKCEVLMMIKITDRKWRP